MCLSFSSAYFQLCNAHMQYCGCSAAVEHLPRDLEVEGSDPAEHWAFFFYFHLVFSNFPPKQILECPKSDHSKRFISMNDVKFPINT